MALKRTFYLFLLLASTALANPPESDCTLLQKKLICKKDSGTMLRGGFLLWQSKIWGLEFASKSYQPTNIGSNNGHIDQKVFVPDFSWSPGLKIELGEKLRYDGWDLNSRWIYYHGSFTNLKKRFNSTTIPTGVGIIPLWTYPFIQLAPAGLTNPLRYGSTISFWNFRVNTIDLEAGRSFFPSKKLPVRFHIGLKTGWLSQHYRITYKDSTTVSGTRIRQAGVNNYQFLQSQFKFASHDWCIGPRIGINSNWRLTSGLSLLAHGAASMLYSFFRLRHHYQDLLTENGSPFLENFRSKENFSEISPVIEAVFGLHYSRCFKSIEWNLDLAYEAQYWWAQNHARRNYPQGAPAAAVDQLGDLQMHGLSAMIGMSF